MFFFALGSNFSEEKIMLPTSNKLPHLFPLKWLKIIVFINKEKPVWEVRNVFLLLRNTLLFTWLYQWSSAHTENGFEITAHLPKKKIAYAEWTKYFISRLNRLCGQGHWACRVLCTAKEGIMRERVPWESVCGNNLLMSFSMVAFETWFCSHILMYGEK